MEAVIGGCPDEEHVKSEFDGGKVAVARGLRQVEQEQGLAGLRERRLRFWYGGKDTGDAQAVR